MGQSTPNMAIYVPSVGETNFDAAFLTGMNNVDAHDHTTGKGVQIPNGGIANGALTSGKMNSSFYEEGTFVPTIGGSAAAGAGTYTTQVGRYTRVGDRIFYQAYIVWTNLVGAAGNLQVQSLPFTSANIADAFNPASVWAADLTYPATQITAYVNPNATFLQLNSISSGAAAAAVALDTTGSIMVSGHFET